MLRAFLIFFALWQPIAAIAQGDLLLYAKTPDVLGKTLEDVRLELGEPDTTIIPQYGDLIWMYRNVEDKGLVYIYRFLDNHSIQFMIRVTAPKRDRFDMIAHSMTKRRVDETVRKLKANGILVDQTVSRVEYEFGGRHDGYFYTINALFRQYLFTVWREEHRDAYLLQR